MTVEGAPTEGELPDRARVVVIGGGVIGTSTAYHLARLGWTDVVLLEQGQLSSGTTWHAAGLLGQLRATESGTRLVQYSARLYGELEAETGLATGLKRCGGVTVARTPDRLVQLRRTAATAEAYDLECELLTPPQALERYPILEIGDLLGALWLPGDCTVNPVDVTASLARGARMRGVRIAERTRVTDIVTSGGRVTGVVTDRGAIEAEVVVNCAGQWAKAVGLLCGVDVPLHSAEHFYVVTEAIAGVRPDLPILRDPDGYTYVKEEVGGLVVGGFEPEAKPWVAPDALPYPFEFQLLEEDWDHFSVLMESAVHRLPVLQQTGLKKLFNGPESFTPDNQFILGEAPGLRGLLRRGGVQLGRHRLGRWRRQGAGRVDRRGGADERSHGRRYPTVRPVQRQQPVAAGPGGRSPRASLRGALAQPGTGDGPPLPPFAAPSPARGQRGCLRVEDGLGTSERLRPGRAGAPARLHLGQA